MMRKYFCPKCKGETFEEVSVEATVSFRIKNSDVLEELAPALEAIGAYRDE